MRQIVFDTETTGLSPDAGHRVIEIGCVELINRRLTGRHYHVYLQPDREIDAGAQKVHGITSEFLADKARFADIANEFLAFIDQAELIAHNAAFDIGFLNMELRRFGKGWSCIEARCSVTDTLVLARSKYPGQKNTLDALCKRLDIDNSKRELHGALLDSEILAEVYLAMTAEQYALSLDSNKSEMAQQLNQLGVNASESDFINKKHTRPVIKASDEEVALHDAFVEKI